jgi:hypothetical protein
MESWLLRIKAEVISKPPDKKLKICKHGYIGRCPICNPYWEDLDERKNGNENNNKTLRAY